jgi:hypothetical protein
MLSTARRCVSSAQIRRREPAGTSNSSRRTVRPSSGGCVQRRRARAPLKFPTLLARVELDTTPGGEKLLAGEVEIEVSRDGRVERTRLDLPPGAPSRPPSEEELGAKVADCVGAVAGEVLAVGWETAPALIGEHLTS